MCRPASPRAPLKSFIQSTFPSQQRLYFNPLPHGHGAFGPIFIVRHEGNDERRQQVQAIDCEVSLGPIELSNSSSVIAGQRRLIHRPSMSGVALKTVKHLFAACANRCSHPGCAQEMVTERGVVVGEICHITASSPKGPRYDPKLTDDERDSFANLILLCPTHHKLADDDKARYTPALLRDLKKMAAGNALTELTAADLMKVEKLHAAHVTINVGPKSRVRVDHADEVHAQTVKLPRRSRVKKAAHPDSIAAHLEMSGYVKYLIRRYQKYQHGDKEKIGRGKYVIIYNAIRADFGRSWEDMAQRDFAALVAYLHLRIRNSKLGRILGAQGNPLFSSYADWLLKPERE
jgi:hypothetical protein